MTKPCCYVLRTLTSYTNGENTTESLRTLYMVYAQTYCSYTAGQHT